MEASQVFPSRNEDLLNQIIDEIVPRRQPPADKGVDRVGIGVYEFCRGLAILLQNSGHKCNIIVDTTTAFSGRKRTPTHCLNRCAYRGQIFLWSRTLESYSRSWTCLPIGMSGLGPKAPSMVGTAGCGAGRVVNPCLTPLGAADNLQIERLRPVA